MDTARCGSLSWAVAALCSIFSFFAIEGVFAGPPLTLNAQVAGDGQRTRFVSFLSRAVEYRVFTITDPYRVVIDLPEVDIQVPGDKAKGLVVSSRAGLFSPGKSRIVIDLAEPALVEKAEILPAENSNPVRLVLELSKTTHKAFAAASKAPPPPPARTESTAELATDKADRRMVIVLDAGHGGTDNGAHGRASKTAEKDITLAFTVELKKKLEETGRYRVIMTRDTDILVPLDDRAQLAVQHKAALLISIHADSLDPKQHTAKGLQEIWGGSIHTLDEKASDAHTKAIVQQENTSDLKAGLIEVSSGTANAEIESILNDLENRTKKNRSTAFANFTIDRMKEKMRFNVNPLRHGNWRVLKAAGVPAVLVELGYLTHPEDEKLLISKEWRAEAATHFAATINAFMVERQVRLPF